MRVSFVLALYLVLSVALALSTPIFSGKEIPIVIWGLSTFGLLGATVSFLHPSLPTGSRLLRIAGRFLIAAVVSGIAGFTSWVLMVNIWERLGQGH